MINAICIRCGDGKGHALTKCKKCGFEPTTDEEKAKSIILSEYHEIETELHGKSIEELKVIGERIKGGEAYEFDQQEVDKTVKYMHEVNSITPSEVVWGLVKFFGPPALLLGAFLALLLLTD